MIGRIQRAISDALGWLLHSDIIGPSGGVRAWYDPDARRFSFYYSESTGYAITTLLYAYQHIQRNPDYLHRARQCADWLLSEMRDETHGGFWCRRDDDNKRHTRICTFDNGMILTALCNLYHVTGQREYVQAAQAIHRLLMDRVIAGTGLLHRFIPEANAYEPEQQGWSRQSGCFLSKVVIGALLFRKVARAPTNGWPEVFLDHVVERQLPSGQFITDRFAASTFLHPHCYTLEGLLAGYHDARRPSYRRAVELGLAWLLKLQKESGGFPHLVEGVRIDEHESADINAQVLRIWTIALQGGWLGKDDARYCALVERVLARQCRVDSRETFGGFEYGYSLTNERLRHLNSWATMFGIQSLEYARRLLTGGFEFDPCSLV